MLGLRTHRLVALISTTALLTAAAVTVSADAAAPAVPLRNEVVRDVRSGLLKMVYETSPDDPQYFAGGRFHYQGAACARCEVGPAVASAALFRRTGEKRFRDLAVNAMDTAIDSQFRSDGWGTRAVGDNALDTMFFGEHLGMLIHAFGPTLDDATRTRYLAVLQQSADSLISVKAHTYAVNGNINIGYTVVYGMAWRLTGEERYKQAYDEALALTVEPGPEYPQFGFRQTAEGGRSLGRDSAGYLVEHGDRGYGYDPAYAMLQTDFATQGYLVTGDARLLTLANQLTNRMLRGVGKDDWRIDLSNGTRVHEAGRRDPFTTPALLVSSQHGRPEMAEDARDQTVAAARFFDASGDRTWNGIYQNWGVEVATFLLVVE